MNEKIPLSLLAEKFAKAQKCSYEEAENIIRIAFSLSTKSLIENGSVDFPGLGSFIVENTDGARTVNFTPDENWAAIVNSPFDMFSPQVIPENIDIDLLESESKEEEAPTPRTVEIEYAAEIETEPEPNTAAVSQPPTEEAQTDEIKQAQEIALPEVTDVQKEPTVATSPILTEKHLEQPSVEPAELEPEEKKDDSTQSSESLPPTSTFIGYRGEETEDEPEIIVDDVAETASGGGFMKGFIVGLIVGLALGALGLCCYVLFYVNSSAADDYNIPLTEEIEESYIPPVAY